MLWLNSKSMFLLSLIVVTGIGTGCSGIHFSLAETHRLFEDDLIAILKEHMPPGTSIDAAKEYMDSEGFRFHKRSIGSFSQTTDRGEDTFTDKDHLLFSNTYTPSLTYLPTTTVRMVAITLKDGYVDEIFTCTIATGPS
ncbi:MAG: hypothetical protein KDA65_15215 [Planctomycetaceae bacterium]|nr:hypothetical protein [Planctomycetaceae bacterium]